MVSIAIVSIASDDIVSVVDLVYVPELSRS